MKRGEKIMKKAIIEVALVEESSEKTNKEIKKEISKELSRNLHVIPWATKIVKITVKEN